MARRLGKSFADLINTLQQLLAGLSSAKDDPKQAEYAQKITARVQKLRELDAKQEALKADLHTTTEQLKEEEKQARLDVGSAVSYLEAVKGKFSPDLQRYGIAKRQKSSKGSGTTPSGVS